MIRGFPANIGRNLGGGFYNLCTSIFSMSSVIVNCRCSIGGFSVGVNWVLGRALVSIFVCGGGVGVGFGILPGKIGVNENSESVFSFAGVV